MERKYFPEGFRYLSKMNDKPQLPFAEIPLGHHLFRQQLLSAFGCHDQDRHGPTLLELIICLFHIRNKVHVPSSENAEFLVLIYIKDK